MIEFGGVIYYLDLNALNDAISPTYNKDSDKIVDEDEKTIMDKNGIIIETEMIKTTRERIKEIDGPKYDVIRLMLETIITYNDDFDDSLGYERALSTTQLSYRIAFNTLYNYGILKEKI
jgi:hypothetical protein